MILLLVPFVYIAICSGMSSALPPVDYKKIGQAPAVTVVDHTACLESNSTYNKDCMEVMATK